MKIRIANSGILLGGLLLALLAGSISLRAADKPRTVTAIFTAQMQSASSGGSGNSSAGKAGAAKSKGDVPPLPGLSGNLNFDGELSWDSPQLRVDLTERTTGESLRLHVDFNSGDALLLYPDTLNGIKGKLGSMDQGGYIAQFKSLLMQGEARGELPKGWTREKTGSEKISGTDASKWKVSGPSGEQVLWWIGKDDKPLKVTVGRSGGTQITLNFASVSYGGKIDPNTFTVSKDFTVVEFKETKNKGKGKS